MHDTDDKALVLSTGNRYDDDMRDLAYEFWLLKADRNATRTHRMLAEKCRGDAEADAEANGAGFSEIDDDSLNIPTVRQVQRWARDGRWAERAADDIARIAPKLYKDANARLFALVAEAQAFDADVLMGRYGDPNSPGILATREKVAARVQAMAGVGMAGVQQTVTIPTPSVKQLRADETPAEIGARMHEKLMEFKERR